jgi:hypothetical protein
MRRKPSSSLSCNSPLRERTVPPSTAVSGNTLSAWPAWKRVTLTTAESSGSVLRETRDCSRLHQGAAGQHHVDRLVRHRGVAAAPGDLDLEAVGAGHHRPFGDAEAAGRHARPVVQAEHHVHGEALEQALLDHDAAAALVFLGRLEDEIHRAVEIAQRCSASAAPSSIAVWPSWPQACITPWCVERWGKLFSSASGSASMSARRPMERGCCPARWATTPVRARPRCTSRPRPSR